MGEGFTVVINFLGLYATYMSYGGKKSRRTLTFDLLDYFGNIIVVVSS